MSRAPIDQTGRKFQGRSQVSDHFPYLLISKEWHYHSCAQSIFMATSQTTITCHERSSSIPSSTASSLFSNLIPVCPTFTRLHLSPQFLHIVQREVSRRVKFHVFCKSVVLVKIKTDEFLSVKIWCPRRMHR